MDEDLSWIVQALDSPDEAAQVEVLQYLGLAGAGLFSDLVAAKLKSGSKKVRRAALRTLGLLGSAASKHTGAVEALVEDREAEVAADACTALGNMQATAAAAKLVAMLSSPRVEVAIAASQALSAMDSGADAVESLLASKEPRLRAAGVKALSSMSTAESYMGKTCLMVGDDDCWVSIAAAEMVRAVGSRASAHAPAIGRFLKDKRKGVIAASAAALAGLGEGAASEAAALEALLADRGEDLSSLPLSTAGVVPKVSPLFRKPACAAAAALGAMGAAGASSAAKIADCLTDKDADIRVFSVAALGAMGKTGATFEPQVLECLSDPMPKVVAAACTTLGQFAAASSGSESIAGSVGELLVSEHPAVRSAAAKSLGMMGEAAQGQIEGLLKLFGDTSPSARVEAVRALSDLGEVGQMYAGVICQSVLFDASAEVRVAAVETLASMGPRGACFTEEVETLLEDPLPGVRGAATKALECFARAAVADVPREVQVGSDGKPLLNIALMFPGQGSQYVKMLAEVKDIPAVQDMISKANEILGYDILDLCLNGPEEKLEQTRFCQPAMYIGGLAAVELLRRDNPEAVERCRIVAGLSLGEYTALTVAGVFDFETGLRLVKLRGEAMQEAAEASPQKMLSVAGLEQSVVERLCEESSGPEDVCRVANFLFPKGFSCAGNKAAIERLEQKALETEGCLQAKPLKISGAFHTSYMEPAKQKLLEALRNVESDMKPPKCEVYMNATAAKISPSTPPAEIIQLLGTQLCSCVLWEPTVRSMIKDGITEFYECGPMKQLKAMMKRINMDTWKNTTNIHV